MPDSKTLLIGGALAGLALLVLAVTAAGYFLIFSEKNPNPVSGVQAGKLTVSDESVQQGASAGLLQTGDNVSQMEIRQPLQAEEEIPAGEISWRRPTADSARAGDRSDSTRNRTQARSTQQPEIDEIVVAIEKRSSEEQPPRSEVTLFPEKPRPPDRPETAEEKILQIEPGGRLIRIPEDDQAGLRQWTYSGPPEGVLIWRGKAEKNEEIVITNGRASQGTVEGELPGIPCIITVSDPRVAVAEAPGPSNDFRRLVLRFDRKRSNLVLTIKWEIIH